MSESLRPSEPTSPLESQLKEQAAEAKRELHQPVFSSSDYARLRALAEQARDRLVGLGLAPSPTSRLARAGRVLGDVLAVEADAGAEVVAPSETDVYMTSLELGQLAHIAGYLAQTNSPWNERVMGVVDPEPGLAAAGLADRRFRLQFAAMCRQAGFKVVPPVGEQKHDATVEVDRWRIGLVGRMVGGEDTIEPAVVEGGARLEQAKLPGMIVLEVTSLLWPERRVLRTASDSAAVSELHRRADDFLVSNRDRIGSLVNPDFVFGVLAVATLPTFNVSTKHVAFSTSFRIASICEDDDPRMERLRAFARRFERVG